MDNIEIILNTDGIAVVAGTAKDEAARLEMERFIREIAGAIQTLDYAARTEGARLGMGDGE